MTDFNDATRADHLRRVKLPRTAAAFERLVQQRNFLLRLIHRERVSRYLPPMGNKITRDICHEAGIPIEDASRIVQADLEALT